MSEGLTVLSLGLLVVSAVTGYFLWKHRILAGLVVSADCSLIGVVGVLVSNSIIQFDMARGVTLFAVFGAFVPLYYLFGKSVKTLFLLPIPIYLLIDAYVGPRPILILVASYVWVVVLLNALEFSKDNILEYMGNSKRYSTALLLPFAAVQRFVHAFVNEDSRNVLAAAYFGFFTIFLLVLPLIVGKLFGGLVTPEILLGIIFVYLAVSDQEFHKIKEGASSNNGQIGPDGV